MNTAETQLQLAAQGVTQYPIDSMNRWSAKFWKLRLPSNLGTKAVITTITDEGAKVLSMGVYIGLRTATVDAVPYDGSTYEGETMKDESTGTLWAYAATFPDGFETRDGEDFLVSLGHIFKCPECRGQGRVRCSTCGGKVRWHSRNWQDEVVENVCSCGDGRMSCSSCTGYGEQLKVLRVKTRYVFNEAKEKQYMGRLPEQLLMGSTGNVIFRHTAEFRKRAIAEAIDGFRPHEFTRLMADVQGELRSEVATKVSDQMVNPKILNGLIDGYFLALPNPVAANKRLQTEMLPIRMKCEVSDVPVRLVKYAYKGQDYSLYAYGTDGRVWPDGKEPTEFTWKMGVVLGLGAMVFLLLILASR
jgi:hypothetical protein